MGRPQSAAPLVRSLAEASAVPWRLLFLCSPGDREQIVACGEAALRDGRVGLHVVPWDPGRGDFARKTNLGARLASAPFLFCGADDLAFQAGWDVEALRVARETGAGVVGTNDCANPATMKGAHSTHSLVARWYAERGATADSTGAIYCELYDHQCVDNELCETAMARSAWAFAGGSRVCHRHPIFDRSTAMDATYAKALAKGKEDIILFQSRRRLWTRDLRAMQRRGLAPR